MLLSWASLKAFLCCVFVVQCKWRRFDSVNTKRNCSFDLRGSFLALLQIPGLQLLRKQGATHSGAKLSKVIGIGREGMGEAGGGRVSDPKTIPENEYIAHDELLVCLLLSQRWLLMRETIACVTNHSTPPPPSPPLPVWNSSRRWWGNREMRLLQTELLYTLWFFIKLNFLISSVVHCDQTAQGLGGRGWVGWGSGPVPAIVTSVPCFLICAHMLRFFFCSVVPPSDCTACSRRCIQPDPAPSHFQADQTQHGRERPRFISKSS